ncbi:MAG: 8-oxo-dGTP diphosphatase [Eubacterium sp.]|nr:8-oxo-dGTP diphosphatase [Eubacterium sp.]
MSRKQFFSLCTLCYIERDGQYLMLHRTAKEHDINKNKWIGVGGHFEKGESPDECLVREVKEETGYTLTGYRLRGILTFISGTDEDELMFLYTADGFSGTPCPCDEGELAWIPIDRIEELELWEGDRAFLKLLRENAPFFTMKLTYDADGKLIGVETREDA